MTTGTLLSPDRVTAVVRPERRDRAKLRGTAALAASAVLLAAVWSVLTWISDGWIPSVGEIGAAAVGILGDGETAKTILVTSQRIAIAFFVATPLGFLVGFAMGLNKYLEGYFRPLVIMMLATPDPVYIIVVVLLLGATETSSLVALTLAVLPFVVTIVHANVKARDRSLDDMSRVYRFTRKQYTTQVLARQVAPALILAARTSFAFAWKIVVLVEALSQPKGVGAQIYYEFRLLDAASMIAWTIIFIVLMRVVDAVVFGTLERRLLAWSR